MLSEVRPIFLETELSFPPFDPFQITNKEIRKLYQDHFEPGKHGYQNLNLQGKARVLSTLHEDSPSKAESRCEITDQSILIQEKSPSMPVDEFAGVVKTVLVTLGEARPPIFFQKCKIQCLSEPQNVETALHLLGGRVAKVIDKVDPFERYPSYFGVRFRFLPLKIVQSDAVEGEESEDGLEPESAEWDNEQGFVTVRFETYDKNAKQIWMEIESRFPCDPPIGTEDGLQKIEGNILTTFDFLSEKCRKFLDQFDISDTDEGGET
jgi:hypothetical protein